MGKGSCRPEDVKLNIPLPFVRKYSFMEETVRDLIVCSQYRYLSIVSDGAVNPEANFDGAGNPRNNLFIEFDNGDIWKIDSETQNLNIERYGSLFFNHINYSTAIAAHVIGGYGNLYLVLTMEKYQEIKKFKRHNPSFCVAGHLTRNGGGDHNHDYWAGTYRIGGTDILAIPFIPKGYEKMSIMLQYTGLPATITINTKQFCCDDTVFCAYNASAAGVCTHQLIYSSRQWFRIFNGDVANSLDYCLYVTYLDKSDQNGG